MTGRRRFLKLAAGAAGVPFVARLSRAFADQAEAGALSSSLLAPRSDAAPASFARAIPSDLNAHAEPDRRSAVVRRLARDEVVPLLGQTPGEAVFAHNSAWFQTDRGFVYSSWAQPVENAPQTPTAAGRRFWGEISVPFVDARSAPDDGAPIYRRLYYGSVYRAVGVSGDAGGAAWYELGEGLSRRAFIPAHGLRRFDPQELAPISPGVKDKRIEVDTRIKTLTAYEGGAVVLRARVATGKDLPHLYTPVGYFRAISKRPSAHLVGLWGTPDAYDLPGVPFLTTFTPRGAAIHGAYWHNDYGAARSHGCVNVPPDIARWCWRWTAPAGMYDGYYAFGSGTPIIVSR